MHTSLVIPADIPTVPIAEKTSNITSAKENGCIISMKIVPVSIRNKFVHITTLAFLIAVSSSLLLNTLQPAASIRFARTNTIRTTTVVVLIPPAVDPGLPPMNIRIIVTSLLPSVNAPVSVVLNPAVLAVTE